MSYTANYKQVFTVGGETDQSEVSKSGTNLLLIDRDVPDATTDLDLGGSLDVSACTFFAAIADVAMTLETNDGSAPADTIALAAGEPYVWHDSLADAFALATDVTSFFATNASGSAGTIKIKGLSNNPNV
jgi:hypothetical protein